VLGVSGQIHAVALAFRGPRRANGRAHHLVAHGGADDPFAATVFLVGARVDALVVDEHEPLPADAHPADTVLVVLAVRFSGATSLRVAVDDVHDHRGVGRPVRTRRSVAGPVGPEEHDALLATCTDGKPEERDQDELHSAGAPSARLAARACGESG